MSSEEDLRLEVIDPDERLIAGWANVEVVDRQNELIPKDVLERAMYAYMDRGGHIMFAHSARPVGKVLKWEVKKHPKAGAYGVFIVGKIFRDYETDNQVWEMVKRGELRGFSVGGRGVKKMVSLKEEARGMGLPDQVGVYTHLELYEISLAGTPANPYAEIVAVNYLAKGETKPVTLAEVLAKYNLREEDLVASDACFFCAMAKKIYEEVGDLDVAMRVAFALYEREVKKARMVQVVRKIADLAVKQAEGLAVRVDVMKPFGAWDDFDDCVSDMKSKGYNEESAKRICGSLKAKLEKAHRFFLEAVEHLEQAIGALSVAEQSGHDVQDIVGTLREAQEELWERAAEDIGDSETIDLGEDFVPISEEELERMLAGVEGLEKGEARKDRRPPKRWWDHCYSVIGAKPDYTDEQIRAICGSMWYHGWGIGSPKGRRKYA